MGRVAERLASYTVWLKTRGRSQRNLAVFGMLCYPGLLASAGRMWSAKACGARIKLCCILNCVGLVAHYLASERRV